LINIFFNVSSKSELNVIKDNYQANPKLDTTIIIF